MKKLSKIILVWLGCLMFTASFAAGWSSANLKGFYIGATGGVNARYFDYDISFQPKGDKVTNQDIETVKHGGSAGVVVGYQQLHDIFGWGIELNALYNFGEEQHDHFFTSLDASSEVKTRTTNKVPYQFNLALKPAVRINETTFLYLPVGVSLARVEQTLSPTTYSFQNGSFTPAAPVGTPFPSPNNPANLGTAEVKHYAWGLLLGLGIERQINSNFALFAEANTSFFNTCELKHTFVVPLDGTEVPTSSTVRPHLTLLRIGFKIM